MKNDAAHKLNQEVDKLTAAAEKLNEQIRASVDNALAERRMRIEHRHQAQHLGLAGGRGVGGVGRHRQAEFGEHLLRDGVGAGMG